ncbi:MAG TPA: transcriptional regulator [Cyanobacteria bacterium UBA8803]|nr:transcriptional regulator [Cyanobacteria bacterium UBA9273]HBL58277.1 transcriptional regulator [Cyanobacteria bacterium UBA8803]
MALTLSSKTQYAILALIELAQNYASGEPVQMQHLATQQDIPDRYLEQLLAMLKQFKLVRSYRGPRGGYLLAREPRAITLLEIVRAMEGEVTQRGGTENGDRKTATPLVQEVWHEACQAADAVLASYTLQNLMEKWDAQRQSPTNFMYYI